MTNSFIGQHQATEQAAAVGYRPWFGGPFRPTDVPVRGLLGRDGGYVTWAVLDA
jgi:hypothetical protein